MSAAQKKTNTTTTTTTTTTKSPEKPIAPSKTQASSKITKKEKEFETQWLKPSKYNFLPI